LDAEIVKFTLILAQQHWAKVIGMCIHIILFVKNQDVVKHVSRIPWVGPMLVADRIVEQMSFSITNA